MKMIELIPQTPAPSSPGGSTSGDTASVRCPGRFWVSEHDLRDLMPGVVTALQVLVPQYTARSQAWLNHRVYLMALAGYFDHIPEGSKIPYREVLVDTKTAQVSAGTRVLPGDCVAVIQPSAVIFNADRSAGGQQ